MPARAESSVSQLNGEGKRRALEPEYDGYVT